MGIKLKAVHKRKKYIVKPHICDKVIEKIKKELVEQIKKIQKQANKKDE